MSEAKTERSERLPLAVDPEVLKAIRSEDELKDAANIVVRCTVEVAVSIIDNLDPLTAAFVLMEIRRQSSLGGNYPEIRKRAYHARDILSRAEELRVRGTLGLCHARDQVFRETGYFAGI